MSKNNPRGSGKDPVKAQTEVARRKSYSGGGGSPSKAAQAIAKGSNAVNKAMGSKRRVLP